MSRSTLDQAEKLARGGKWGELINLLEPQVPLYRDSFKFYYLLGLACLYTGDIGGAQSYVRRAGQIDPSDLDIMLCQAALELRRGNTPGAIDLYLRVLEERPGDRLAKGALDLIRSSKPEDMVAELIDGGKFDRFYPKPAGLSPKAVTVIMICGGLALLAAIAPLAVKAAGSLKNAGSPRPAVSAVNLSEREREEPVVSGGSCRYILTDKEALACFDKAKAYFQEYRDNAALIEINRLLGSNASDSVKVKAATLKGFVSVPDFRTVRDAPSYADVMADPALYDGCSVIWRGRAANVALVQQNGGKGANAPTDKADGGASGGAQYSFDFLVGYEDKKRLDGIVPVTITGPININGDKPFELLAVIRTSSGTMRLEGMALHELLQQ